jgi:hypothetical protein
MIAVIVALGAFFALVVIVEVHARIRRGTKRHVEQALRNAGQHPEDPPLRAQAASIATYWECDKFGLWRLWNQDRKHMGLVAPQEGYNLWRVFTTYLWPSQSTIWGKETSAYKLIEREDLLEMGISSFAPNEWTPVIEGKTVEIEEAKRRVEATIKYIHDKLEVR